MKRVRNWPWSAVRFGLAGRQPGTPRTLRSRVSACLTRNAATVSAVSLLCAATPVPQLRAAAADATGAEKEVYYADPTIYPENRRFYLIGTRHGASPGFTILESDDLRTWRAPRPENQILRAGEGAFGTSHFWAPQIVRQGADYLLTYTANEQVALARSAAVTGPFRQEAVAPIDASARNIDSFLFRDDDGRWFLYHVRFGNGNFIWVGEFDLARSRIRPGTLTRCLERTEPWEATAAYRSAPIMEGPTVVKLKDTYYLFYSANHYRSIDYAVGYAVSRSPTGPWTKYDRNPILHRSIVGENGSGHGDVFRGPNDRLHYVYHVHHSDTAVHPRRTRIVPLVLSWNDRRGLYDIAVDASRIIKPLTSADPAPR